jgi:hypothetical protein
MLHRLPLVTLGLILAGGLLAAQDFDTPRQQGERGTRTRAEDTTRRERQAATAESEAGVPEERVRETLRVVRERGIPAYEAALAD